MPSFGYVILICFSTHTLQPLIFLGQSRGGRYGKNIISLFIFLLLNVDFTIVSEQCSQNNFPITKTNPFMVTKYKKVWWLFRPKWGRIQIFFIILSLLLKITNIHITNTHNIQIKQTVLYFQVQ